LNIAKDLFRTGCVKAIALVLIVLSQQMLLACPTCGASQSFTFKTILLSLGFSLIPAVLIGFIFYKIKNNFK